MLRGKDRFLRRLSYESPSIPHQATESTTALRLKAVLENAVRNHPELKRSQQRLFIHVEEFSRLSKFYVASGQNQSAGASSVQTLIAIAKVVSKIWRRYESLLSKLINSMPNFNMDPCTRESLKIRLGHIGHYVPTVRRLLDFAKKFNVFRSIQIRPIHIDPYDLSTALSRCGSKPQQRRLDAAAKSLGSTGAWQQKSRDAVANEKRNLTACIKQSQAGRHFKVHAEIQLLCYYEQRPNTKYPPRVLKSSKDACFLCDLFVKTHGKFYIPRTHGKVYSLWMLPNIFTLALSKKNRRNLVHVVDHFNRTLEETIVTSALRAKRTIREPYESAIFSIAYSSHAASTTTIRQISEPTSPSRPNTPLLTQTVGTPASPQPVTIPLQNEEPKEELGVFPPILESSVLQLELPQLAEKGVQMAASISPPPILFLRQGKPSTYVFDKTSTVVRFHTPKIHVELSHEEAQRLVNIDSSPKDDTLFVAIMVEVSWLGSRESNQLSSSKDHAINLNPGWTEITATDGILFTDEGLLMRKGFEVVRIRAHHVDSQKRERKDSLHG